MHEKIILPTSFLPPIDYFYSLKYYPCRIDVLESFPKQTIRNRCFIVGPNGIQKLSIPLIKYSNHTRTQDIRIDFSQNWQIKMWRTIESAYNRSAYFEFYKDEFKKVFFQETELLIEFNHNILEWLILKLKIKVDCCVSDEFIKVVSDNKMDLRFYFNYKIPPTNLYSKEYFQVFEENNGFVPHLSIIDLLFSQGPESQTFL